MKYISGNLYKIKTNKIHINVAKLNISEIRKLIYNNKIKIPPKLLRIYNKINKNFDRKFINLSEYDLNNIILNQKINDNEIVYIGLHNENIWLINKEYFNRNYNIIGPNNIENNLFIAEKKEHELLIIPVNILDLEKMNFLFGNIDLKINECIIKKLQNTKNKNEIIGYITIDPENIFDIWFSLKEKICYKYNTNNYQLLYNNLIKHKFPLEIIKKIL